MSDHPSVVSNLATVFATAAGKCVLPPTFLALKKNLTRRRYQLEKSEKDLKGQRAITMKALRDPRVSDEERQRYRTLFYQTRERMYDNNYLVEQAAATLQTRVATVRAQLHEQKKLLTVQMEQMKLLAAQACKHGKVVPFALKSSKRKASKLPTTEAALNKCRRK